MGGSRKECQRKRREGKKVKGKKGKERGIQGKEEKGKERIELRSRGKTMESCITEVKGREGQRGEVASSSQMLSPAESED